MQALYVMNPRGQHRRWVKWDLQGQKPIVCIVPQLGHWATEAPSKWEDLAAYLSSLWETEHGKKLTLQIPAVWMLEKGLDDAFQGGSGK